MTMGTTNPAYVLGHSDRELARLRVQARLLEPSTRRFLHEAGVVAGMRVLDIGSGAGDVAFLAAEIVGPSGAVIGTDKAADAVAAATRSAQQKRLPNVSFREGDPGDLSFERPFDAVIGRYVLLYQADPAVMVRKLVRHLRPGGVILFQEPDWLFVRSDPPAPTYDRCCQWITEAFRRAGIDSNMLRRLYSTFVRAGLTEPTMRLQTLVGGPAASADFLQAVADLVGTLLPAIERHGVATTAEVGLETLAERLQQEVASGGSLIVGRSEICAWARV